MRVHEDYQDGWNAEDEVRSSSAFVIPCVSLFSLLPVSFFG
jgi:hypothetical protein